MPSQRPDSRCSSCGALAPIVWVHGHGQCSACGTNIAPCCDGLAASSGPAASTTAPRALLFDLDGTLIDSLADIAHAANHVRGLRGLPPWPRERIRTWIGDGPEQLLRGCLELADEGIDLAVEIREFRSYYFAHPVVETVLYPGIHELLEAALDDGRELAVVTNKPEAISKEILAQLGVADRFAALIGCDTTPFRKPAPEPVHAALARLGCLPHEAWMIGDGPQDIRAGEAAAVETCAVGWGFGDEAAVARCHPRRRAHDVPQLARILGLGEAFRARRSPAQPSAPRSSPGAGGSPT